MGELDKNIHRKETDPYGKIFTHPLEKDKKQKEENSPSFKKTSSLQTFSILTSYFQRLIGLFESQENAYTSTSSLQKILNDIKTFRKLLATLAGEDCSHNSLFNQQLSKLWHNLLDDCNSLPSKIGCPQAILDKVKFFIL